MTVAVLLITESDVTQLISWGAYFARASETDLLVLQVQRHRSQSEVADVSLEQAATAIGVSLAAEVRAEIQELPFALHLESQEEQGDDSETAGQAESIPASVTPRKIKG